MYYKDGVYWDDNGRPISCGINPQRAGVTRTSSGQVVAALANHKIRVYAVYANGLLATALKLQSNASDISGTFSLAANGGFVLPEAKTGWFETASGETLNVNMTVATTVGFQVIYEYIPA